MNYLGYISKCIYYNHYKPTDGGVLYLLQSTICPLHTLLKMKQHELTPSPLCTSAGSAGQVGWSSSCRRRFIRWSAFYPFFWTMAAQSCSAFPGVVCTLEMFGMFSERQHFHLTMLAGEHRFYRGLHPTHFGGKTAAYWNWTTQVSYLVLPFAGLDCHCIKNSP